MRIPEISRRDILISVLIGVCCCILCIFMMMLTGPMWMNAQIAWAGGQRVNWGALPYLHGVGLGLLVTVTAGILTVMLTSGKPGNAIQTVILGSIAGLVMAVAPWNATWGIFLAIETGSGSYMELYQLYALSVLAGLITIVPVAAASAFCYRRLDMGRLQARINKKIF